MKTCQRFENHAGISALRHPCSGEAFPGFIKLSANSSKKSDMLTLQRGNFFGFLSPWKSTNRIRKIFFGWPVACRPYGRCLHQSRATTFRRHACIEHSLATLLVRLCHLYGTICSSFLCHLFLLGAAQPWSEHILQTIVWARLRWRQRLAVSLWLGWPRTSLPRMGVLSLT